MKILDSDIKKFKELYVKYFDIHLSDEEAREKLPLLVRQMEIIYKPITKTQLESLIKRDSENLSGDA